MILRQSLSYSSECLQWQAQSQYSIIIRLKDTRKSPYILLYINHIYLTLTFYVSLWSPLKNYFESSHILFYPRRKTSFQGHLKFVYLLPFTVLGDLVSSTPCIVCLSPLPFFLLSTYMLRSPNSNIQHPFLDSITFKMYYHMFALYQTFQRNVHLMCIPHFLTP